LGGAGAELLAGAATEPPPRFDTNWPTPSVRAGTASRREVLPFEGWITTTGGFAGPGWTIPGGVEVRASVGEVDSNVARHR
jgi:hypothetical protein